MSKKEHGFTLVELAVSLVIIGLLIGGVLKGREMIGNAGVSRFIHNIRSYDAAVVQFRNAYDAIPGDITHPSERIPGCNTSPCNSGGDGNGLIDKPATNEARNFWRHLAMAGLVQGIDLSAASLYPATPWGFQLAIQGWNNGTNNVFWISDTVTTAGAMSGKHSWQVDMKMDDGDPTGGIMTATNGTSTVACVVTVETKTVYNFTKTNQTSCIVNILMTE